MRTGSAMPLNIGITGHRDLREDEIPALEKKVESLIRQILVSYPNTSFRILSPLAEGADRLVARVGLRMGVALYSVLPMEQSAYEEDFSSQASLEEFRAFLENSEEVITLPPVSPQSPNIANDPQALRDFYYDRVGAYIARYSQFFIIIWNGIDSDKTGGTANTVKYRMNGIPRCYKFHHKPLDMIDSLPAYHIRAGRTLAENNGNQADLSDFIRERNGDWCTLYPNRLREEYKYSGDSDETIIAKQKDYHHRLFTRIDSFNKDARRKKSNKEYQETGYSFFQDEDIEHPELRAVMDCYRAADALAVEYQGKTNKCKGLLIALALTGFLFITIFDEILSFTYVLMLFPLIFFIAFVLYRLILRKNFDNKFYDYRALAEGLRVFFFWKICGWEGDISEYYLRKYDGEINWISIGITSVSLTQIHPDRVLDEDTLQERIKKTFRLWILDQKEYFSRKSEEKVIAVKRMKTVTILFFFLAMISVFGFLVLQMYYISRVDPGQNFLDMRPLSSWMMYHYILLAVDTFIAFGASFSSYIYAMAFTEESKQYKKMSALFFRGERVLSRYINDGNWRAAYGIIIEMGLEALDEGGDWLLTKRSRPIEIPTG